MGGWDVPCPVDHEAKSRDSHALAARVGIEDLLHLGRRLHFELDLFYWCGGCGGWVGGWVGGSWVGRTSSPVWSRTRMTMCSPPAAPPSALTLVSSFDMVVLGGLGGLGWLWVGGWVCGWFMDGCRWKGGLSSSPRGGGHTATQAQRQDKGARCTPLVRGPGLSGECLSGYGGGWVGG